MREVVTFAGCALAVEHEGELAKRVVELVFARFPRPLSTTPPPRQTLSLHANTEQALHELRIDGELRSQTRDLGELAEHALAAATYCLVDRASDGLVVHAGLVSRHERGLLLPAQSGSGKSTLTAWLTLRGFVHVSDELGHLSTPDQPAFGLRRPVELKTGGRALIEPLLRRDQSTTGFLDALGGCILDPALLGATRDHALLSAIVFPRYRGAGAPLELQSLSPAAASSALLQCTINARNLPSHGLHLAAQWARALPAFALNYGSFAGIDDVLLECLEKSART